MTRNLFRLTALSVLFSLALAITALAQDFQQTYRLGAGSTVSIHNISGNVKVTGYGGDAIIVSGIKEGRDRDQVQVEDRSSGGRVEIGVHYPNNCHWFHAQSITSSTTCRASAVMSKCSQSPAPCASNQSVAM
jgi:hypothetical protein